jgi:hypothetical protein
MSNVVSIHPENKIVNLYEVVDAQGLAIWGGNNPQEAMRWFAQRDAERVIVSGWLTDYDDATMVGEALDITDIIKATVLKYALKGE